MRSTRRRHAKQQEDWRQTGALDWMDASGLRKHRDRLEKQALHARLNHVRWWRILIIASCLSSLFCASIMAANTTSIQNAVQQAANMSSQDPAATPGRLLGETTLADWLNSPQTPVPDGYANLQWVTGGKATSITNPDQPGKPVDYWYQTYSFWDKTSKTTRQATLLLARSNGTLTVVATPTLDPVETAAPNQPAGGTPMPADRAQLNTSTALTNSVQQWAAAWVGASSDTLTALVGDPDPSMGFQAQNWGTMQTTTVNWLATRNTRENGKTLNTTSPAQAVADVTIGFTPTGSSATASTSMLLLIADPMGGDPRVIDWQPDYCFNRLKPYSHAVSRQTLETTQNGGGDGETQQP